MSEDVLRKIEGEGDVSRDNSNSCDGSCGEGRDRRNCCGEN